MRVDVDGNIYFEPGEIIPVLKNYRPGDEPGKFVPKFPQVCLSRKFIGKVKPCSKVQGFLWWCLKFYRTTSIKDCENCDAPDEPQSRTTQISLVLPTGFVGVLPQLRKREDPDLLVS
jgi:hypothetical protein